MTILTPNEIAAIKESLKYSISYISDCKSLTNPQTGQSYPERQEKMDELSAISRKLTVMKKEYNDA